ncbi:MAG TPA: alpha/beta hydrolase [Acidimicrobiia bacterium]|nr:alpha/beta hydrolase [Acidimicrobiia bacterium]
MRSTHTSTSLAFDDTGGAGRLLVMLPGAGDLRSEYRFLVGPLAAAGHRVVSVDLPGHGDSPTAGEYTVASTASAIGDLIESLGAGPAVIVACSFAPAAAVWLATERPELVDGVVALSPHFHADPSLKGRVQGLAIRMMLRGSWAAGIWSKLYAGWYKAYPPADLDVELNRMRIMLADAGRRKAVRETLTAGREGVADRMKNLAVPSLAVFGALDDHFDDPVAEAERIAGELGGDRLIVEGAGHYPHVERPEPVLDALAGFFDGLA